MNEDQLINEIERYLNGEMTKEERARFETLRGENAEVSSKFAEHKQFMNLIKQYGERLELERRLDAIHSELDVEALEDEVKIHPSWIVNLWRNHHSKISVAASIAIFAVLCTLFFTGYLNNREMDYVELKGKIINLEHSTHRLSSQLNHLNGGRMVNVNMGSFRGTGFAISSNGCIITDYHVIKDADSVYVQNIQGKSYKVKILYSEPSADIAVLEIADSSFKSLGPLPYDFKKSESPIGEGVFTIGYPRDAMVLGPGYLTANTGYKDDSTSYQVSIPANPGNSGGPLLDSKGNVIGIISGKETNIEDAAFALKSSYIIKAMQDIPVDSLKKKDISFNSKNTLANLNRVQQIKKLQNYVFMVRVY